MSMKDFVPHVMDSVCDFLGYVNDSMCDFLGYMCDCVADFMGCLLHFMNSMVPPSPAICTAEKHSLDTLTALSRMSF